ncbi:MAG: DHH family phosphoesterase [Patescibacteria group bacterium]
MRQISKQFFNLIKKSDNILISFPVDWDGDAIASSLALFLYLKKMGKNVEIGSEEIKQKNNFKIPIESFRFLPSFSEIKNSLENLMKFVVSIDLKNAQVSQVKYTLEKDKLNFIISPKNGFFTSEDIKSSMKSFKYDLIITIDAKDLESLGRIYDNNIDFFYKTNIVNIDHSPDNEEFGQLNIIDLNAVSNTEIIYKLLEYNDKSLLNEEISTCLLTGIIFKTKSFKTNNLTPKTLKISSELIEMGAKREEIVSNLYRSRSLNTLKLWGRVLNNLQSSEDKSIIWANLFKNDFKETRAQEENLQDIIDELIISIPTAKIIIIFYSNTEMLILDNNYIEEKDKEDFENKTIIQHNNKNNEMFNTNVILYSVKNINSLELIKKYNPTGTRKIAQTNIKKPLKIVEKEIINTIDKRLEKIF